jgi:hypothetical protein
MAQVTFSTAASFTVFRDPEILLLKSSAYRGRTQAAK